MKQAIKDAFKIIFHPYINLPWSNLFWILYYSFGLWCVNLAFYGTVIVMITLLSFLEGVSFPAKGLWNFTRTYFYDGQFFYIWDAWRVHVALFIFCFLYILTKIDD